MDSNSGSDKEGAMAGMEHELSMSDIKEVEVSLGAGPAGGGDKATRDESPVEFVRVVKTYGWGDNMTRMGSKPDDEEGVSSVVAETGEVTMSTEVDQGAGLEDKPTLEENSNADVAHLIQSRQEALKLKQITRRAAWQKEVKAELEKRAEYKRQMETTHRNQTTSWKDRRIFSKISVQARKTFRSERTQFLFNKVFPIIAERDVTLNCRLVSKGWKDVIDSWLSATSVHSGEILPHGLQRATIFSTLASLRSFNQKSASLSKNEFRFRAVNPFIFRQLDIGNAITLVYGVAGFGTAYWIEMTKLLHRWGKEIWTALYMFDDGSIEMMYEFLVKYLSLMPNLRELSIVERDRSGNLEAEMLRSLGKDVLAPLKSRMERNPLPELRHLKSINFGKFTPAPLLEAAMAKYGVTLESVSIDGCGFDKYSGEYLDLAQFAVGRRLPFTEYSCSYLDSSRIMHWNYQFPKLNKLDLTYLNVKEGPEVENIFKTVNSCGSSLRRLKLVINFGVLDHELEKDWRDLLPRGMKLELPHLEWLDLIIERSEIADVDFLLPLVSLKELSMYYLTMGSEASAKKKGNGIIQFAGYRDRLYDSNVWTLLPELRLVTLNSIAIPGAMTRKAMRLKNYGMFEQEYPRITSITGHTRDGYRKYRSDQKGIQQLTEQLSAFT